MRKGYRAGFTFKDGGCPVLIQLHGFNTTEVVMLS